MVEDFISKAPLKEMRGIVEWKYGQILKVKEEGGVMLISNSPTSHSRHSRTSPTPAPSEDRLFKDWSSVGSRSPSVIPPPQSVPIEGTLITPGIENIDETEQAASQHS